MQLSKVLFGKWILKNNTATAQTILIWWINSTSYVQLVCDILKIHTQTLNKISSYWFSGHHPSSDFLATKECFEQWICFHPSKKREGGCTTKMGPLQWANCITGQLQTFGIGFSHWETTDQVVQSLVLALSNKPKREGASPPFHPKSLLQFSLISRYWCTKLQRMWHSLRTVFCHKMNMHGAHHTHNW